MFSHDVRIDVTLVRVAFLRVASVARVDVDGDSDARTISLERSRELAAGVAAPRRGVRRAPPRHAGVDFRPRGFFRVTFGVARLARDNDARARDGGVARARTRANDDGDAGGGDDDARRRRGRGDGDGEDEPTTESARGEDGVSHATRDGDGAGARGGERRARVRGEGGEMRARAGERGDGGVPIVAKGAWTSAEA